MGTLINPSLFPFCSGLDLVDDFGGAMEDWNLYLQVQTTPQTLCIPAGTYDETGQPSGLTRGTVVQTTMIGENRATTIIEDPGQAFAVGAQPIFPNPTGIGVGPQPLIQTTAPGDTTVTLLTPAQASRYVVDDWICIIAYDMQGSGSNPQNNQFFEFRQITNIAGGVLTLDQGLKYAYKSTYPQVATVGAGDFPQGGPAQIIQTSRASDFIVHERNNPWPGDVTVKNLTITTPGSVDWYGSQKHVTFDNCEFPDIPPIPSFGKTWTCRDCIFSGTQMEADKLVEIVTFDGCTGVNVHYQSSSIDDTIITDSAFALLRGIGKNVYANNSTFAAIRFGAGYGAARSATFSDCAITEMEDGIANQQDMVDFTSHAGGVLVIPFADMASTDVLINLVPGGRYFLVQDGNHFCGPAFTITDVTRVGADIHYTTTLDGTEGEWALAAYIGKQDCPSLTVENCTGSYDITTVSYPEAVGRPYHSYYFSGPITTYNNLNPGYNFGIDAPFSSVSLFGNIQQIIVSVTKAYTGVQNPLQLRLFTRYNGTRIVDDTFAYTLYNPLFDLRTVGTRVVTPGTTLGTVGADTDLDLPIDYHWMYGGIALSLDINISGESSALWPEFTVEVILDQFDA